jgi:hypothetical protein
LRKALARIATYQEFGVRELIEIRDIANLNDWAQIVPIGLARGFRNIVRPNDPVT